MTNRLMKSLALAATLLVAACGPGDDDDETYEVSSSALSGSIGGETFEFKSGYAEDKFDDGELWVELHMQEVEDPCDPFAYESSPHIIISTTPEPKDVSLSLQNNITFAYQDGDTSQNDIATTGRLIIDSADGETLTGGLYAIMNANEVDGQFEVPICVSE